MNKVRTHVRPTYEWLNCPPFAASNHKCLLLLLHPLLFFLCDPYRLKQGVNLFHPLMVILSLSRLTSALQISSFPTGRNFYKVNASHSFSFLRLLSMTTFLKAQRGLSMNTRKGSLRNLQKLLNEEGRIFYIKIHLVCSCVAISNTIALTDGLALLQNAEFRQVHKT